MSTTTGSTMADANANMVLHCDICPRKPDFSDISHLLTHVASKGHLSNYFKLKVKADQDPATRAVLTSYDSWYEENGLQELLRERMSLKEKKRGNHNATSVPRRTTSSSRGTGGGSGTKTQAPRGGIRLREMVLDPQLDRRVKVEPPSRSATPAMPFVLTTSDIHRQFAPPMQPWIDTSFGDSPLILKQESPDASPSEYSFFDLHAARVVARRDYSDVLSGSYLDDDYENEPGDNMLPKGVQWPGMAMFDSATPEMRRKRNQKKSSSVLKQLQATSEVIRPKEQVFDAAGTLRVTRVITGEPNFAGAPIEGESEPEPDDRTHKRPRRRPRPALAEKNVNTNRVMRQQTARPLSARGQLYNHGGDDVDELTYGPRRPAKRKGISIHRDNSGPEITFDQPGLNHLTAPFRPGLRANVLQQRSHNLHAAPRAPSRQPC